MDKKEPDAVQTTANKPHCVYAEGGLGDIIYCNYVVPGFLCLPSLKIANPDCYVTLVLLSQNSAAPELFRWHPYFDNIIYFPWTDNARSAYESQIAALWPFRGSDASGKVYSAAEPTIFLSEYERRLIDKIKAAGRFVTFHPWSGEQHRNISPVLDLSHIIDAILAEDWNVVVIGGHSPRIYQNVAIPGDCLETDKANDPRVFNLLPYSNVRLCAALVAESRRFIGTDSCFGVQAGICKVRSLIMTSHHAWDTGCHKVIQQNGAWIIDFDIWRRGEVKLEEILKQFLSE
jgi:hypothetical protein